jgi:HAD superfamily hydrolase (TIGR01509 family)
MTPPKAVIFDLGKVLVDFDYGIVVRRLRDRCERSLEDILRFVNYSPLVCQFELGQLSTEAFFSAVQRDYGFRGTLEEFRELFGNIFTAIEPMVQLHAELRARGVPTYIFSNTNEIAIGQIRRQFAFYAEFDGHILSYEHGAMKPDARLYEVVERSAGCRGQDLLYFDDRPENVEAGLARGWRGIVHVSPAESRAAVCAAGLLKE